MMAQKAFTAWIIREITHISIYDRETIAQRIRTLENTEGLRVDYLLGKITKERLATRLAQKDNERLCMLEIAHLAELVATVGSERLQALSADVDSKTLQLSERICEHFAAINELAKYVKSCKARISEVFQLKIRFVELTVI